MAWGRLQRAKLSADLGKTCLSSLGKSLGQEQTAGMGEISAAATAKTLTQELANYELDMSKVVLRPSSPALLGYVPLFSCCFWIIRCSPLATYDGAKLKNRA